MSSVAHFRRKIMLNVFFINLTKKRNMLHQMEILFWNEEINQSMKWSLNVAVVFNIFVATVFMTINMNQRISIVFHFIDFTVFFSFGFINSWPSLAKMRFRWSNILKSLSDIWFKFIVPRTNFSEGFLVKFSLSFLLMSPSFHFWIHSVENL